MATEIASLGVAIDSSSAKTAAEDLRRFANESARAEGAQRDLANATEAGMAIVRRGWRDNSTFNKAVLERQRAERQAAAAVRDRTSAEAASVSTTQAATASLERTNRTVDRLGVRTESSARSYGAMVAAIMRGDFQQANASLATLASRMAIIPALTTPIGAAVAATIAGFIGFGAVAVRSMRQLDDYNRSIIATGNYASTSAKEIRQLARDMASTGDHRIGDIESALAAVVGTGRFAAESIESISAAVDNMGTVTTASVEEAVDVFQELAKSPADTLQKLNQEYHFLTLEIYNNVRALEENGESAEAARVAQGAFASELRRRAEDVRESGSIIAQAADVAKSAWQEALAAVSRAADSVFGERSDAERIVELGRQMADLREKIDAPYVGSAYKQQYQDRLDGLEAERDALIETRDLRQQREREEADARRRESRAAQAAADIDAISDRYDKDLRYRQERNDLETAYRELVNNSAWDELARRNVSYNVDTGTFHGGEYQKARDAIDAQAASRTKLTDAEKEAARHSREQETTFARLSRQAASYASELEITADSGDKLTKVERFIKVTRDQMAAGTVNLTGAMREQLGAQLDSLEASEEQRKETVAHNEAIARETELRARLAESIETAAAAAEREVEAVGMSRRERELSAEMDKIANDALRERRRLIKAWGDEATEANETYMAQLRQIDAYEQQRINMAQESAARRTAAEGDWRNGVRRAVLDVRDETVNYAKMSEAVVTDSYGAMTNAIMTFSRTGKFEIKDMTIGILESMMQMAAQIAASRILMSILGAFMPAPTGATGTTAVGYQSFNSARGNAFEAGRHLTNFARGGVFDRATQFPMAGGRTGQLGEEGAEAIMPLGRDSSGRLGVRMVGGEAGGGLVVNAITNVSIASDGTVTTDTTAGSDDHQQGRMLGALLTERVKSILVEQSRPGGILWGMSNGR